MQPPKRHLSAILTALAMLGALVVVLACGGDAAPASSPAAAVANCGKDADCKGDRICVKGDCVTPR